MSENNGEWAENRKMVLYRLQNIDERLLALLNRVESLDRHLTSLSVRASLWGGLAGLIGAAGVTAVVRRLIG